MAWITDGSIVVFILGILLALIRFAWIGYWRTHRNEFLELSPTRVTGNHIIVKTPARRRRGRHLIIIDESVDETDEGSETEEEEEPGVRVISSTSPSSELAEFPQSPTVSLLSRSSRG